ncbi:MAG: hypothetical protein QG653_491 [Patescibacteria group bacterium]|nr:hypothetical protein [Patescibacteria group bacterium]
MQAILPYLSSPYITVSLFFVVILVLIANVALTLRLRKLFKGQSAESLEPLINEALQRIKELEQHDEMLGDHALKLDERLTHAVRNVSTVRYKAFESGTSNQSFSVAFVNEQGNGIIISSLHHRDRVTTYAKPIANYKSEYDLSDEEKQVLEESKKAHEKK